MLKFKVPFYFLGTIGFSLPRDVTSFSATWASSGNSPEVAIPPVLETVFSNTCSLAILLAQPENFPLIVRRSYDLKRFLPARNQDPLEEVTPVLEKYPALNPQRCNLAAVLLAPNWSGTTYRPF
jgi:hypothetical protein